MTGIMIDVFTVILLVILAFICGYSAGHKFGRDEVRRSFNAVLDSVNKTIDDQTKRMEEARKQMESKGNPKGFLELLNQLGEDMKKIRTEQADEAKKEKDGDE